MGDMMAAGGLHFRRRKRVDVAVVGGGPAGARSAALLAEGGLRVVLLERGGPEHLKPCAGGMPEAVFQRLGLPDDMVACRARGYRFTMLRDGRPARVLRWPGFSFVTVRRRRFDEALRERAAGQGCDVRYRQRVVGWDGETLLVRRQGGGRESLRARCYLWANGAMGAGVRPRGLGFQHRRGAFALAWSAEVELPGSAEGEGPLEFFLDHGRNPFGYFWRFPLRGGCNLGAGTVSAHPVARRAAGSGRRLRRAFGWWLERALGGRRPRLVWVRGGVIPIRPTGRLVRGVHLALGDAGGLVNPLNGEGIQYALASGEAAAEAVLSALGTGRLDRLADYPRVLWGQRRFLRLGVLAAGLQGMLAFGRCSRRSLYPELVELSHLLFRLRGLLRCSTAS